jgi:hypothetical protein
MVWDDVQRDWKHVASMYCKDTQKIKPEAFFGQVANFVRQFQVWFIKI